MNHTAIVLIGIHFDDLRVLIWRTTTTIPAEKEMNILGNQKDEMPISVSNRHAND